jgi:hypothetical protein
MRLITVLLENKFAWLPSSLDGHNIDHVTSRVEGFFGKLKNQLKHVRRPIGIVIKSCFLLSRLMFQSSEGLKCSQDKIFTNTSEQEMSLFAQRHSTATIVEIEAEISKRDYDSYTQFYEPFFNAARWSQRIAAILDSTKEKLMRLYVRM